MKLSLLNFPQRYYRVTAASIFTAGIFPSPASTDAAVTLPILRALCLP
jgi:hypothetical protein